jgi:hypothetical protein
MADIKDDAVTLGNGPLIKSIRLDDTKQIVRAPSGSSELFDQIVTDNRIAPRRKHLNLPA